MPNVNRSGSISRTRQMNRQDAKDAKKCVFAFCLLGVLGVLAVHLSSPESSGRHEMAGDGELAARRSGGEDDGEGFHHAEPASGKRPPAARDGQSARSGRYAQPAWPAKEIK